MAAAGWLDADLAAALKDSPGLRNVLVHEYVAIDLGIVAAAVPLTLDGFGAYVAAVAARLYEQPGSGRP